MAEGANWQAWRFGKKEKPSVEVSQNTQTFLNNLRIFASHISGEDERLPKIQVSDVAGALAFLYEKFRTAVDDREEHLLRKFAIERILKRKILLEEKTKDIGLGLIRELIYAHYLPNKEVPENRIPVIESIIEKYLYLRAKAKETDQAHGGKKLDQWIIGVMSYEIETKLKSNDDWFRLVEYMAAVMKEDLAFDDKSLKDEEKTIQIVLAVSRALGQSDKTALDYILLMLYLPKWPRADKALIERVAANLGSLRSDFDRRLSDRTQERVYNVCKKEAVVFRMFFEVVANNLETAEEILSNPEALEIETRKVLNHHIKEAKKKKRRVSIRSVIYIFFTKMLVAFGIEVPLDLYFTGALNSFALTINLLFPPVFMFIVAATIRIPKESNTKKVIAAVKKIIYPDSERQIYQIKTLVKRGFALQAFFNLFYIALTLALFYFVGKVLYGFGFNFISIGIFIFFLTIVSFFSFRIRHTTRELIVYHEREGYLTTILDFFLLPIINVGRWFSKKFARINVIAIFFDFIIEAPFKIFIVILEEWFSFLREKREDIY